MYTSGVNAGKTIDQMGLPKGVKFDEGKFRNAILKKFRNNNVDFILIDGRHLSNAEKTIVRDYINCNHSSQLDKLITIGF